MSGNHGSDGKPFARTARLGVVAGALVAIAIAGAGAVSAAPDDSSPAYTRVAGNTSGMAWHVPDGAHPNGVRWQ